MKNAKELIEEEERDRKKAEKRRAKKKVWFSFDPSSRQIVRQNKENHKKNEQLEIATDSVVNATKTKSWSNEKILV